MRALLITVASGLLTSAAIANAFIQKRQFFPAVVYITKSNPSMAVLYIQAFVFVMLLGKMMGKIFFGQLRAAEVEHLMERSWYAITETCLAFTVFRDDFSPKFVALFTLLLFLKAFHWLAEERIDYMERSPIITFKFHIRAIALLIFLGTVDSLLIHHAFRSTVQQGATVQLVFGFEYSILLTMVVATLMKYVLHTIDLQSENPWENKSVYSLYTELITGFFKTILYIVFVIIMIKIHTFPLFAIRPMYLTLRAFKKSVSDAVLSRRAIAYMNTVYPDATEEELSQLDNVCIICRDEMTSGKKLPCNHIFHAHCLRSWFQRQQSCPTCRLDVLRPAEQQQQQQQEQRRRAQAQAQAAPQQPQNVPGFMGMPPAPPFGVWNPAMHPGPLHAPTPAATAAGVSGTATATSSASSPGAIPAQNVFAATGQMPPMAGMPPMPGMPLMPGMPPFMPMPLPMMGMPPPPSFPTFQNATQPLSELSYEELKEMEGQERSNIEARIKVLRNVHSLLDTAIIQLNQYSSIIENIELLSTIAELTKEEENKKKGDTKSTTASSEPTPGPSGIEKEVAVDNVTDIGAKADLTPKTDEPDSASEIRRRRLEKLAKPVESLESKQVLPEKDK